MKIQWAVNRLAEGEKVRRKIWLKDEYLCLTRGFELYVCRECDNAFSLDDVLAMDWELFQ